MDQQLALGRAIAEQRRRHGLSQAELARLLERPALWVSLVERGLAQAEPMPVLEAVASAQFAVTRGHRVPAGTG